MCAAAELLGNWRLNEKFGDQRVRDKSDFKSHGKYINGFTAGKKGYRDGEVAIRFRGADQQYVRIPHSYRFEAPNGVLSFWFKTKVISGTQVS